MRFTVSNTWRVKISAIQSAHILFLFKKKWNKSHDTGKNPAQVEAHEKWYQNLQRLRREQRQELDNWKREKRQMEEEERKRIASHLQQQESDAWVAEWRRQRESVRERLDRWKVIQSACVNELIVEWCFL